MEDIDFSDLIDSTRLEPVVTVDIDSIDDDSKVRASGIVSLISRIYKDDEFLKSHPDIHERLNIDLQNIKELIKSKAINEKLQESLVNAIAFDASNEKLYTCLNNLQKTQLAIGERLDKVITGLRDILEDANDEETTNVHRGRGAFIRQINA